MNNTPMLCIGYGEAKAGERQRRLVLSHPLTRHELASLVRATLSHKGRGKNAVPYARTAANPTAANPALLA